MKRSLLFILGLFCSFNLLSQQIVQAEYFFDVDPGFGAGNPITITANQDISDLLVSIDVSGISDGIHNLILRAKDDNGSWSLTHKQIILKTPLPSSSPVSELEYYFDNDPGEGNGTAISFTSGVDVADHLALISTTGVDIGIHTLNIRAKDDTGIWSHVASQSVLVSPPITTKDIVEVEYFVGNDPGLGNGSLINVTAGNDLPNVSAVIPISDLDYGINQLSIRSKNSSSAWSHTIRNTILKMKAPNVPDIVKMEYFFNDDPGWDNGTSVSYSADPDWSDISVLINPSSLPDGLHILYIRSKDSNGIWSQVNSTVIQKTTIPELTDITMIEYFFDMDPGLGQGTSITITPDTEIQNQVATISTAGLSKGVHTLFVRSKNQLGEWSHSQTKSILITSPDVMEDITKMEYFIDTDPGYGMGTEIVLTDMPEILDLNSIISLSGLSKGVHQLFVRSRDANGKWSHAYHRTFLYLAPDVDENIDKIEYYIGDDPGFGNGTDISMVGVTDVPDVIDFSHMIDINTLDAGVQRLSLRSRNDQGVWTHTITQPIYVYKHVNGNMVKAEYFIETDPGYGLATEITFPPEMDQSDHIFPIDITGLDLGIYRLHVRYLSENGIWSQDEITTFYLKDGMLYEMVEGEYFFDMDPGLGMATPFSFTPDTDVADLSVLILTTGLDAGEHDLYIRTKNEKGEWSLTNVKIDIEVESTLPLKILSFDVKKHGAEALLEWTVEEAINSSHFEVERTNQAKFEFLGRVESFDQIAERNYHFIDSNPFEGLNYYRLKQVDLDGNFQYSPIRSVNFGMGNEIIVYPNPTINEIRVDGILDAKASYLIYDSGNRMVKKGSFSGSFSVDFSDLESGGYHFILENGSDIQSFLVIKI